MPTPRELTAEILDRCRTLGFAAAGVCAVEPSRYAAEVRAWLSDGKHGSMDFMEEFVDQRLDPARVLEGGRWMIMVADLYTPRDRSEDAPLPERHARLARYARGRDYHEVIKRRLHRLSDELRGTYAGSEFRSFTDTAPVTEREHAARAGLGWIAKNTMLIHPRLGSYFVIGGVLTTMELEQPQDQRVSADHCGTCTRCIDACPTRAITPYKVDGSRCISYLTIEHRGEIEPGFFGPMGKWLYGCDICQEVCPHNSTRSPEIQGIGDDPAPPVRKEGGWGTEGVGKGEAGGTPAPLDRVDGLRQDRAGVGTKAKRHPDYTPRWDSLDVLNVLNWDEEGRRAAFTTSAMKRATLEMMKRNALIVAANVLRENPDTPAARALESRVRQASEDPSEPELVRRTAREVLRSLHPA